MLLKPLTIYKLQTDSDLQDLNYNTLIMLHKLYQTNFIALPIIEYLHQITYNGILLTIFSPHEVLLQFIFI